MKEVLQSGGGSDEEVGGARIARSPERESRETSTFVLDRRCSICSIMVMHGDSSWVDRSYRRSCNHGRRTPLNDKGAKRNVLREECSKPPARAASDSWNHDDCGWTLLVSSDDAGLELRDCGHPYGVDRLHWILPNVFDSEQDQRTQVSAAGIYTWSEKALENGPAGSDSAANLRGNLRIV
jgi:hypothetical protein